MHIDYYVIVLCTITTKQHLNLGLHKFDELDCLIQGIHFIDRYSPCFECFYYANASHPELSERKPFDFRDPYPYLVVNVGSGVSMLSVRSLTDYKRVSGTRFVCPLLLVLFLLNKNNILLIWYSDWL